MAIYLKKFETTSQYNAYTADTENFILPNVSLIEQTNTVEYTPYVPETRVVAKFNITDTSNPTPIGYNDYISGFSAIEIDGVAQPSVVSAYTFNIAGEHTVKYTLADQTSIGRYAFYDCRGLTSVTIPDSVTSIGKQAFGYCRSLPSIDIPDSVTSIGEQAFNNCSGLTSCTIGSGVTSIGEFTFYNCYSLTSVTIPDSVTNIDMMAFYSATSLTTIVIPDSVTSIGNSAFRYCSGLTSVTIEATTPPTLGTNVFNGTNDCPIYVPSGSVDTYKAATNWSTYADRIQAKP